MGAVAEHLLWKQTRGTHPADIIENLLPIQWTQTATMAGALQQGEDIADRNAEFMAPPLAWLMWQGEGPQVGWLVIPNNTDSPFELLENSGAPCMRDATARIR